MAFYILHRNWRARVSMNEAASWIWTLWVLGAMQVLFSLYAVTNRMFETVIILGAGALVAFGVSFLFSPAAKRKHVELERTKNAVLFSDDVTKA